MTSVQDTTAVVVAGDTATYTLPDGRRVSVELLPGEGARLNAPGGDAEHLRDDSRELVENLANGLSLMIAADVPREVCRVNGAFRAALKLAGDPRITQILGLTEAPFGALFGLPTIILPPGVAGGI